MAEGVVSEDNVILIGTVGRQSALHKENSGYAAPTLGRHIFTFRGYLILFSIRNPYINCFTNLFFYLLRERNTCSFRSMWTTLPLNLFFPTHFERQIRCFPYGERS
jgi:hypothetical protein